MLESKNKNHQVVLQKQSLWLLDSTNSSKSITLLNCPIHQLLTGFNNYFQLILGRMNMYVYKSLT